AFAFDYDFENRRETARFWYASEEKLEPRLGERWQEPGAEREQPLGVARDVQMMARDLEGFPPTGRLAEFLLAHPEHRHTARRAARGIGMGWGLAEETGKAARFLCSRRLSALEVLLPLLKAEDGMAAARLAPEITGDNWRARGGFLCPILAGAALADDGAKI